MCVLGYSPVIYTVLGGSPALQSGCESQVPRLGWGQGLGLTAKAGSTSVTGWHLHAFVLAFFSVLVCFHKYFRTHCLVLWQVSFRNNVWFISSLYIWPCGLTPSQSFVYLFIPSKVDCRVLFWSPAVDLVFPIMGNVSVSCLLLLTFHLLIDLKLKLRSPVCIFSSSSCKTSKEKQLQLNNQEPSYSSGYTELWGENWQSEYEAG